MNAKAAPEKINKSQLIRDELDKGLRGSDVVAALAKRNIEVTPQAVSNLTTKHLGGSSGKSKKSTSAGPSLLEALKILGENGGAKGISEAIKAVKAAKDSQALIDSLGGLAAAEAIVEQLGKAK